MCKVSHLGGCIESQAKYQRVYSDWILKDEQIFAMQRNRQRENLWPYIEVLWMGNVQAKGTSHVEGVDGEDFWNMMESFGEIYFSKEFIYYLAYRGKEQQNLNV